MLRAQGQTEAEATTVARAFSTHSMRRGAATSMAKAGANGLEIAGITRHASMAMVKRYCDLGGQNYAAMKRLGV
jgi:integrase